MMYLAVECERGGEMDMDHEDKVAPGSSAIGIAMLLGG
jgi:hypothetical protein